jgi:hypothetical protein
MSSQAYVGTADRTFRQALIHLLESQYGLLGSQRVLKLLAEDVQELAEKFYPAPEHLSAGWMIFTGTQATGAKAYPGARASDHKLITLAWPVLLPEDLEYLASHPDTRPSRETWFQQRLVRIIEYGCDHPEGPVLLTLADLSAMLGLNTVQISKLLQRARQQTGRPLLTKGYYFDQGRRPSHKAEIIALYESGLDEVDIARRSAHAQQSVGRYIRDYERVMVLLQNGISADQIPQLSGMSPGVAKDYAKIVAEYHPDLVTRDKVLLLPSKD